MDSANLPTADVLGKVYIGEFADRDTAQGDAIDHSVTTGEPLFATNPPETGGFVTSPDVPLVDGPPIAENSELAQQAENAINPPQKLTQKEVKSLFRAYFTVRRDRVKSCGHKFDMARDPRTGCEDCWFAYFGNNGPMTQTADECFQKEGRQTLERIRGKRFVKKFLKFMSTLARFQAEAKAAAALAAEKKNEESNEQTNGGTDDRSIGGLPEVAGIPSGIHNSVVAEGQNGDSDGSGSTT